MGLLLTLQSGKQFARADDGRVAAESVSAFSVKGTCQSLGSSVQFPEGQSLASSEEHWPAQLTPLPQVSFLVAPVSGKQQTMVLLWFAVVRISS